MGNERKEDDGWKEMDGEKKVVGEKRRKKVVGEKRRKKVGGEKKRKKRWSSRVPQGRQAGSEAQCVSVTPEEWMGGVRGT